MKRFTIILVLGLVLLGCRAMIVEKLPPSIPTMPSSGDKILVIPFSDYTQDGFSSLGKRTIILQDSIQTTLLRYGYNTPVYEDVVLKLVEKGIIKAIKQIQPYDERLISDYSKEMKAFISDAFRSDIPMQTEEFRPLDQRTIRELARHFKAKYVLRGRVLAMGPGYEDTTNPYQIGILPFSFKLGSRLIFGIAESEKYEMFSRGALGVMAGSLLSQKNVPLDPEKYELAKRTDIQDLNKWAWIGGTGTLGAFTQKTGSVKKGVVHIQMILQDPYSGEVLWANRIQVEAQPESVFGPTDPDYLMQNALDHAVDRLVEDLHRTIRPGG